MSKNIKLGNTTYSNVDIVKLRNADVADTYIDYAEAGTPKTLTSGYTLVEDDANKVFKDSNSNLYLAKVLSQESDVIKTSNLSVRESSGYSSSGYMLSLVKTANFMAGTLFKSGENWPVYQYSTDNGATWSSEITGVSLSYIRQIIKFNDKVIAEVYSGSGASVGDCDYYITADGATFTKLNISTSAPTQNRSYYMAVNSTSLILYASASSIYSSESYYFIEHNISTDTTTDHLIPYDFESGYTTTYGSGISNGYGFIFECFRDEMSYQEVTRLRYTTNFTDYTTINLSGLSMYDSPQYVGGVSLESTRTDASNLLVLSCSMNSSYCAYIIDVTTGSTVQGIDQIGYLTQYGYYYPTPYSNIFLTSSNIFVIGCISMSSDPQYQVYCGSYSSEQPSPTFVPIRAGDDESSYTGEFDTCSVSPVQKTSDGYMFAQVIIGSYGVVTPSKCCGIFTHAPIVLKSLS